MSSYSIKDLEKLSGIKAHTLRIWEQRYNFLVPERTDTNIRLYNDEDLKLILNVSLLRKQGLKISHIAALSREQIAEKVLEITNQEQIKFNEQIHALSVAMIDLDEERFEKTMSTSILQHGFETTMLQVVFPFLKKIGILWQTGSIVPAQEHFITHLIRQKLIVAIDGCYVNPAKVKKKFVLFLPEGELHELTLLFSTFIIKCRNNQVIYLGQNVPLPDAKSTCERYKPDYVFTILTTRLTPRRTQKMIDELGELFADYKLLLGGGHLIDSSYTLPENASVINQFEKLAEMLEGHPSLSILQ